MSTLPHDSKNLGKPSESLAPGRRTVVRPDLALSPYRVIDLSDEKAMLCGRMLGDLGADVIKVEKPGGDAARWRGPFYKDIPHPERSLFWFWYNANKRGITLDIEKEDGKKLLRQLVSTADFLIESFSPGYLESLQLGYQLLHVINPKIIVTSVTPFGQRGPYRDFKSTDVTIWAMGGRMYLDGNADRAPVRLPCFQTYSHAGAQAAAGSLIAHYARLRTGLGQHVDISMQDCVIWTLQTAPLSWDMLSHDDTRGGVPGVAKHSAKLSATSNQLWPCKDGYVIWNFWVGGASSGVASTKRVVELMAEAGMDEDVAGVDWSQVGYHDLPYEQRERYEMAFRRFFQTKTMQELLEEGLKGVSIAPLLTIPEVMNNPQTKARELMTDIDHEELAASIRYFEPWLKMSETPLQIRRRAPLIGEHNAEMYMEEMGLTPEQLRLLAEMRVI